MKYTSCRNFIECENIFIKKTERAVYCSTKCKSSWNYKHRNVKWISIKYTKDCIVCGKTFPINPAGLKRRKTCSKQCHNKLQSLEKKGTCIGKDNYHYKHGKNSYRKRAIEYYGFQCSKCYSNINLDVHHIDRNRFNNNIENLVVLCRKCHMLTDGRISS